MNQKEFALLGGMAKFKKVGVKGMSAMGKMGPKALKEKYGKDYYKRIRNGEKPSKTA